MSRSFLLSLLLLCCVAAAPAPKLLGDLNDLTRSLAPAGTIKPAELGRLVETGEVVAFRDGVRGPSPATVLYAAAIERQLDALAGDRGIRAVIELALALAPLDGPEADALANTFYPALLAHAGVKPDEAKPRPELNRELAEIGAWAGATIAKLAPKLPPPEAAVVRTRAAIARGRWSEALSAARDRVQLTKDEVTGRAWLAAALMYNNKWDDAEPHARAAIAGGGEAANIVKAARVRARRLRPPKPSTKPMKPAKPDPCDPVAFAQRVRELRNDRDASAALFSSVIKKCAAQPGGSGVTLDAVALLLELAHQKGSKIAPPPDDVVANLARAHRAEPHAVGIHADLVALKAFALPEKQRRPALQAAVARYEEAIAASTTAGGAALRGRLEANAGYLSLALAMLPGATPQARESLLARAAHHLRFALALAETPVVAASRALYDIETGVTGGPALSVDLSKFPQSPARQRAACMLGQLANKARDAAALTRYLEILRGGGPTVERAYDVDALIVDANAIIDDGVMDLHTDFYFAPPCDAATLASPAEPRSTPATSTTPRK